MYDKMKKETGWMRTSAFYDEYIFKEGEKKEKINIKTELLLCFYNYIIQRK